MNTTPTPPHDPQAWSAELALLLAQPIQAKEETHREGDLIGIRVTPAHTPGQATVDLLVTLFFLTLSPAHPQETGAQEIALADYLADLEDTDYHVRMAACRALGQLGDASAASALQRAEHDENRYVHAAATQALSLLEKPRFPREELAGVQLSLWQQVRHLWKPLAVTQTNHRGQVQFTHLPATGSYRVQARTRTHQGRSTLARQTMPNPEEEQIAAAEVEESPSWLPPPQQLTLENGSLFCSFSHDDKEQLVVEFRSDAAQMKGHWVLFRVLCQDTHDEVVNEFIELEPNPRGILIGRIVLGDVLKPTRSYEFIFEPLTMSPEEE